MLRRISCTLSATWLLASASGCAIGGYQASDIFAPVEEPESGDDSEVQHGESQGSEAPESEREAAVPGDGTSGTAAPSGPSESAAEGAEESEEAEDLGASSERAGAVADEGGAAREVLKELVGRRGVWFGQPVAISVAEKTDTRELDALGGEHLSHLYRVVVALEETAESQSESCELVLADGMHIVAFVEVARGEAKRIYEFVFFHDADAALEGARFVVKRAGAGEALEVSLGEFTE